MPIEMEINIESLSNLIREKFRNNKRFFAETIGVGETTFYSVMAGRGNKHSPKIIKKIIKYCKENNLNYEDYINMP